MLCEKCKRNIATFHSKTIINGIAHEEHLCSSCSRMRTNKNISNLNNAIYGNNFMRVFNDILRLESFDCGRYYSTNENIIEQAMLAINKGTKIASEEDDLTVLNKKLNEAIEKEDYERADKIKKEINKLKEDKK